MRYVQSDSGSGTIFDRSLDSDLESMNVDIGYVSEAIDYAMPIKIDKFFIHFGSLYPRWNQKLFDDLLKSMGIDQSQYFRELSRGQKMQVSFASAISIRPKVILLDEITSVLDANARSYFMNYLHQFSQDGGTVLMATNIVSEVHPFANHLILIDKGEIKLDIPLNEASRKFHKLRKGIGQVHEIFEDHACVEVGLNSDNSTSFLVLSDYAKRYEDFEDLKDNRGITAEDIFTYYTRGRRE